MTAEVERLVELSEAVAAGEPGKDYSVLEDELMGYERTPLESSLLEAAEALGERLRRRPEELTSEMAAGIMQALLRCRPGIGGYRARLMAYAGDYGDEYSPVAYAVLVAKRGLAAALQALGPAGEQILAGVPTEVRQAKITIHYPVGGGETADLDLPFEEHLRDYSI